MLCGQNRLQNYLFVLQDKISQNNTFLIQNVQYAEQIIDKNVLQAEHF